MPKARATYAHDGRIGVEGFLVVFIFGLLTAVAAGIGYRLVDRYGIFGYQVWPPLLLLGGAVLIGVVTGVAARVSCIRNDLFGLLMGLLFGCVALYAAWATFLTLFLDGALKKMAGEAPAGAPMKLIIAPEMIWGMIVTLPTALRQVNPAAAGSALGFYITWALEALVWIAAPAAIAWWWSRGVPFCTRTKSWCDQRMTIGPLAPIRDVESMREALLAGDVEPLRTLEMGDPASPLYTQAVIRYAPGERGSHYLTLTTVDLSGEPNAPSEPATVESVEKDNKAAKDGEEFFDQFIPVKNQRPLTVVKNLVITRNEFDGLVARQAEIQQVLAPRPRTETPPAEDEDDA